MLLKLLEVLSGERLVSGEMCMYVEIHFMCSQLLSAVAVVVCDSYFDVSGTSLCSYYCYHFRFDALMTTESTSELHLLL